MPVRSEVSLWYAEAVTRVYAPWLTSTCVGISERQRRAVHDLIRRARQAACLPPLDEPVPAYPYPPYPFRRPEPCRAGAGRWIRTAA